MSDEPKWFPDYPPGAADLAMECAELRKRVANLENDGHVISGTNCHMCKGPHASKADRIQKLEEELTAAKEQFISMRTQRDVASNACEYWKQQLSAKNAQLKARDEEVKTLKADLAAIHQQAADDAESHRYNYEDNMRLRQEVQGMGIQLAEVRQQLDSRESEWLERRSNWLVDRDKSAQENARLAAQLELRNVVDQKQLESLENDYIDANNLYKQTRLALAWKHDELALAVEVLKRFLRYRAVQGRLLGDDKDLIGLAFDSSIWGPVADPTYEPWELIEAVEKWLHQEAKDALAKIEAK